MSKYKLQQIEDRELFYVEGYDILELLNNAGRYDLVQDTDIFEDITNEVRNELYRRREKLLQEIVSEICEDNYGVTLQY